MRRNLKNKKKYQDLKWEIRRTWSVKNVDVAAVQCCRAGFWAKVAAEAIATFLLVYFMRNDCVSSDDFASNCIREWDA